MPNHIRITTLSIILSAFMLQSCSTTPYMSDVKNAMHNVIPKPFFTETTQNYFDNENINIIVTSETAAEGEKAAAILKSLGLKISVTNNNKELNSALVLNINKNDKSLGREGYVLIVKTNSIELTATEPEGLFRGIQTLQQLYQLQPAGDSLRIPCGVIRDHPRFEWRGTMLDVARHFFTVDEVKRYIDQVALYKLNRLHLHLSDDQGWRIKIDSWPKLTEIGGTSSVNNEKPGFYTKEEYTEIVKYAADRFITIVPEIDMPGHTNAALASYPELNCNGIAPKLYTGTEVGFSSLCIKKDITYKFVEDVITELAEITPGNYIHVGGDEASATDSADYVYFIERVQEIVNTKGKYMIGWEEVAQAKLNKTTVAQIWRNDMTIRAAKSGSKVILSPSSLIYIDMKYDSTTKIRQDWAALVEVDKAYNWEPAEYLKGMNEIDILGIEAPLWSETFSKSEEIEYLAFPRLIGVSEIGWSVKENRKWQDYKERLGMHNRLLKAKGINFYRSAIIDWK